MISRRWLSGSLQLWHEDNEHRLRTHNAIVGDRSVVENRFCSGYTVARCRAR